MSRTREIRLTGLLLVLVVFALSDASMAEDWADVRLVKAGDQITFHRSDFVGPERAVRRIQWRQKMMKRGADYIQATGRFRAGDTPGFVVLFVQEQSVERLLERCQDPDAKTCTVTVDSAFQYGGDRDRTMRFLVFQDVDVEQYQYRFLDETMVENFTRGVRKFGNGAEVAAVPGAEMAVAAVRRAAGLDRQEHFGDALLSFTEETKTVRLVQAGDEITFYQNDLVGPDRVVELIEWTHKLQKVQENYIQLAARLDVDGETSFLILFVQQSVADRLLARCQDPMAKTCRVTVDAEFQYGGDSAGTMRFLVYHNRRPYDIFQHRFVNQTMAKNFAIGVEGLERQADELNVPMFGAETAIQGIMKISELGQSLFGDPLRDF